MKFAEQRPYADPEAAARKLIEIANSVEAVQERRIHIEKIQLAVSARSEGHATQGGARSRHRPRLVGDP